MNAVFVVAVLVGAPSEDVQTSTVVEIRAAIDGVVDARGEVFASDEFAFCNDPDFVPSMAGRSFCQAIGDSSRTACPQIDRLCAERPQWPLAWGRPIGFVFWILAWAVIAALLAMAVRAVWKAAPKASPPSASAPETPVPTQELPEAPALRILEWAQREAEAERWDQALLWLQVGLLRAFEDARLIRFHPSKTHGDYLRRLRKTPEPHDVYRQVAHACDRMRFGDGHVDPQAVRAALARARELMKARWLSAAASVLLLLLPALTGCSGMGPSFFEDGPEDLSSLPALLERADVPVDVFRKMPDEVGGDVGVLVVIEPGFGPTGSLYDVMDEGVSVVVLEDVFGFAGEVPLLAAPTPDGPRRWQPVSKGPCAPSGQVLGTEPVLLPPLATLQPLPSGGTSLEEPWHWDVQPLLKLDAHEGSPAFALYRYDEDGAWPGCYLAFGSSQALSNASLTRADNLRWVLALLTSLRFEGGERVWFVDRFAGGDGSGGAPRRIAGSRALAVVVQTGLALVLLLLAAGAAFGPLRDREHSETHAFVEHVRAVGRHYERSGELGLLHAARSLARLVVFRFRGRARGGTAWASLAKDLAHKHELSETEVRQALAHGLEEGHLGPPGPARRATEVLGKILGSQGETSQQDER